MWKHQSFLKRCAELKQHGYAPEPAPGMRLGRGFADLGVEEFLLLPSGALLSLQRGNQKPLTDDERSHLFCIPSTAECVAEIRRNGYDVETLHYAEQRHWRVAVASEESDVKFEVQSDDLEEAFIMALEKILFAKH
jgi:hypothetical protein